MVLNATFNNISVISWRSFLLVKETGGHGENHWPVASHWQTWSHNVVSSRPCLGGFQAYNDWKSNYLATTMAPKNQYKYTLVLTLTNHKKCPKIFFYVARSEFIKLNISAPLLHFLGKDYRVKKNRKSKQWWSTIPSISTKQTIVSHLNSLNTKKNTTYDVGNPNPGLGQAQKVAGLNRWQEKVIFIGNKD